MNIHIFSQGDMSVGILACNSSVEIPFDGLGEPTRSWLREELHRIFSELHDVPQKYTQVWYDDECVDCGKKLSERKCPRCVLSQV